MPRLLLWLVCLFAGGFALLTTLLLVVYSGTGRPLSAEEVDDYMARIESQPQTPGGRHDIPALRRFLEADDGEPFYTVNLYAFREKALYSPYRPDAGTGREAFARFSPVMLRLLAKQASHPVFGSNWTDTAPGGWDRLVIVRYRSRRDIAEVFASTAFAEASAHKWAALERNDRLLVQALHIPELPAPGALVAVISGAIALCAGISIRRGDLRPPAT